MPSPPIDELHAWLALTGTPGLGRRRAAHLLRYLGDPVAVMRAGSPVWSQHLEPALCSSLTRAMSDSRPVLESCLQWLRSDERHGIVTLGDPTYPAALLHSPDPPLMLYTAGDLSRWATPTVAMVGSRSATPQGMAQARQLAHSLSSAGVPVVSGMALGIDAASHEGALQGSAGTIGVLGCGLDQIYPKRHHDLADRLVQKGLLVSEYPLGTPAIRGNFPQRNRIIAGLACVTVVIEAALKSGSLITARLAAEAGRDVLAMPGPVNSSQSVGCHWLIKQGAGLLDDVSDVWFASPSVFRAQLARMPSPTGAKRKRTSTQGPAAKSNPLTSPDSAAWPGGEWSGATQPSGPCFLAHRLRAGPVSIDELAQESQLPAAHWQHLLLLAELEGMVHRLPGGRFQWTGPSV